MHVYVIEPHPLTPDVSPYRGEVWEQVFTTIHQPFTYADRVLAASSVAPLIEGNQILLVDDLDPVGLVNPFWCTYGPSPNLACLVGQDGTVQVMQLLAEPLPLKEAIDALLGK